LVVIATCLVVLTIFGFHVFWAMAEVPDILKGRASFADRAKRLLDQGKLDELLDLCSKHIAEFPADAHGFWFQGQADYRKGNLRRALGSLRKVAELQPDWEAVHTRPLAEIIEARLTERVEKPGLKIVPPNPSPDSDMPPPGGVL
jgi:cytochrome c-type biogenesis protein CcmH/NrfG